MQFAKTLALTLLLTVSGRAGLALETAIPLPTSVPLEASIAGTNDGQSDGAMRKFALACGLLAFAAAAQQAFFSRNPVAQRVRLRRD